MPVRIRNRRPYLLTQRQSGISINDFGSYMPHQLRTSAETALRQRRADVMEIAADAKDAEGYTIKQLQHVRERAAKPRIVTNKDTPNTKAVGGARYGR